MQNPYARPNAAVEDIEFPDLPYQPQLFTSEGRIGRLRYIAYSFVMQLVALIFAGIVVAVAIPLLGRGNHPLVMVVAMVVAYVPVLYSMVIVTKRRLHDLNHTGWLAILMLLPLINLLLGLYLLFWPGSKGRNDYGPAPVKNSLPVIIFGLLFPLAIIGVLFAVAIPAYQSYVQRTQAHQLQMQMQQSQP